MLFSCPLLKYNCNLCCFLHLISSLSPYVYGQKHPFSLGSSCKLQTPPFSVYHTNFRDEHAIWNLWPHFKWPKKNFGKDKVVFVATIKFWETENQCWLIRCWGVNDGETWEAGSHERGSGSTLCRVGDNLYKWWHTHTLIFKVPCKCKQKTWASSSSLCLSLLPQ